MKGKIKRVSLILAAVLLLSLMLGCSSTGEEAGAASSVPSVESELQSTETATLQTTEEPKTATEPATSAEPATEATEAVTAAPTEKPTETQAPETKPTEPKPTEPKPTEPKPTEPKPTEPKPTEPKPTEPKPTEPKPTESKPTEPKPTEPKPTEPKPTEPKPTDPTPTQPTNPQNPIDLAKSCIGKSVNELYSLVGKPISSSYATSCEDPDAEDGLLEYNGFTVWTLRYPDGTEIVYDVY